MRKILTFSIFFILLAMSGCSRQEGPVIADVLCDGEWEGTGEGRGGIILARTTIAGHAVSDVRIMSQSESPFAQEALNAVVSRAIGRTGLMSLEYDGVSGATLTSRGVIDAVNSSMDASMGKTAGKKSYSDCSCDVVVVGAGGAGLCSAIAATDAGCRVIVLEKQGIVGGNTNYSTGGINASGTSFQEVLGIRDSNGLFYDDTWEGGHRLGFPELVHEFVERSAPTVTWLSGLGVDLSDVGLMGGSSVKRTHRPAGGAAIGPHLMMTLAEACNERKVDVRTGNRVTGLLTEHGVVTGVSVCGHDGKAYNVTAKAVIVATGGFGANLDMVSAMKPELRGFSTLNHKGATGDAFSWVSGFDAALVHMDQIQIHPTAEAVNHVMITEAVRGNGAILVNADGKRFVNEMSTRDVVSAAILEQDGGCAYLVFDEQVRASLASIETYHNQGILLEARTLKELASMANMDPSSFENCVRQYNSYQSAGKDPEFFRSATQMPSSISRPPYYAVKVMPAIHHTMGGLRVDTSCRVVKNDGSVIPGLYAAGEVTGGLHGGNRLGGNGVADVVVNGKVAGEEAARYCFAGEKP